MINPASTRGLVVMACVVAGSATGASPPSTQRNFVACPIIRDTEPTPCWVAVYKGEMYYLGLQQDTEADFFPPQQGHKALIEGTVTDRPRICGGIPLDPVKASTLPEIDRRCDKVLPAEGWVAPPARRGALPRNTGGQLATDPVDTAPPPVAPPAPSRPYKTQTFPIPFDFDSVFMLNKATRAIQRALRYAQAVNASQIEVVGYRGAALLSDGKMLEEGQELAKRRAEEVAAALQDIGVGSAALKVDWKSAFEIPDGVNDPARRRVDLVITPPNEQ
jgi:outer membrane protein OmpA-like peptidoglycan-associated protein